MGWVPIAPMNWIRFWLKPNFCQIPIYLPIYLGICAGGFGNLLPPDKIQLFSWSFILPLLCSCPYVCSTTTHSYISSTTESAYRFVPSPPLCLCSYVCSTTTYSYISSTTESAYRFITPPPLVTYLLTYLLLVGWSAEGLLVHSADICFVLAEQF